LLNGLSTDCFLNQTFDEDFHGLDFSLVHASYPFSFWCVAAFYFRAEALNINEDLWQRDEQCLGLEG
jgi:hypothetical protein